MTKEKTILAYKGFDKDFKCRDFQYEVGKEYVFDGDIKVCNAGFHSCEYPMDVWKYYDIAGSKYALVEVSGKTETHNEDSKICSSKLKIKAEISLFDMIKASVDWHFNGWFKEAKKKDNGVASKSGSKLAASGCGSKLAASGCGSKLAASGNYSNLAASGCGSKLAASGCGSKLAASGNYSNLAASGDDSKLAASGDGSNLAASGNYSNLAASGNYSNLAASGDDSKLAASGCGSKLAASGGGSNVIVSAEKDIMVKASINTLICLTHYIEGKPIGFVTGRIGEGNLKPDVWYVLNANGAFTEAKI